MASFFRTMVAVGVVVSGVAIGAAPLLAAETKWAGETITHLDNFALQPAADGQFVGTFRRIGTSKHANGATANVLMVGTFGATAEKSSFQARIVETFEDKSTIVTDLQGTTDVNAKTSSGAWKIVEGTGKYKGITGSGTHQGGITSPSAALKSVTPSVALKELASQASFTYSSKQGEICTNRWEGTAVLQN
jgi:hypothetical protein